MSKGQIYYRSCLEDVKYLAILLPGLVIHNVARNELKRLVDEGHLQLEGERRGAQYLPDPALLERRESE